METLGQADEYPEDADTSHSGFVYYIGSDMPVDVKDYEAWYASWHDGVQEIAVQFLPVTQEQIDALQ